MLFHTTFRPKSGFTHEDQKQMLKLWAEWTPPEGFEVKSFHIAVDGRGFIISESKTAEAAYEAAAPWAGVLLDYEIVPVVDVDRSVDILKNVIDKR